MVSCWQSCTLSHYWLNRFQLTEHDLAPISVRCHQLQWCTNWSRFRTMCLYFSCRAFPPRITEKACVQKRCRPAAWNSSLLVLCSVNQKSPEPSQQACVSEHRAPSPHLSTVPCNLITQMKQAQTISSYKIRNCIWQFFFKQVHTSTAKSISVLPSARRVALVTFYVKQELPPDLEVHQEFC